tara:strand:+ start:1101 stop:1949 length:849 start_codon:yes stop_codon:yes gene_type:complete
LNKFREYFFLFKIHHWIKNLSIFLPIVASHSFLNFTFIECLIYFFNFSIIASIVYLINNVSDYKIDIENKKLRYSVNLDKKKYYYSFGVSAFLLQMFILYFLNKDILIICLSYFLLSILYNQFLKHQKYIDVITLSTFHILRIFYGAIAFEIQLSFYFILFCLSIFLMIGANKRMLEIQKGFKNRPYDLNDQNKIQIFQIFFSLIAVLTFFLYCIDPANYQYFSNQYFLYINLILIILIISNFLYFQRNTNQDIVVFIYRNKINLILVSLFFVVFIGNSVFF